MKRKSNPRVRIILNQGFINEEYLLEGKEISLLTRKWIKDRLSYMDKLQQSTNKIVPEFCNLTNDPGDIGVCLHTRIDTITKEIEEVKTEDIIV